MTVKQFRDTELTNAGFSVSNKAAIGKTQYTTTRAVTTDVDLSNYKIDDLKNLTSLPNEINSGIITDYEMPGNNVSAIKINFNNSNFKDGYVVRAVGIYAKENGSDKEFLHSITVSDSPVYIPAVSGNVFDGFYLTMAIFTGNNKNISINISDETYVTTKRFNDAILDVTNIAKSSVQKSDFDEFKAKINDDFMAKINAIDLSKPEKNANSYTDQKISDVNAKINNIDLSSAVTQANNYTDTKFNNIDLSKPETSANAYTDNKINALNINQYAKNTDLNSNVNNINSQINNVKNQVNNNTNDINTNRNNINNKANYWDLNNSVNQLNANISQAEANAKAYADSKYRFFDNENDAIEAGKYLPAGTLIIVRG